MPRLHVADLLQNHNIVKIGVNITVPGICRNPPAIFLFFGKAVKLPMSGIIDKNALIFPGFA